MNIRWKRTLRTESSERFLGEHDGREIVAVDVHYLPGGTVAGTVILLEGTGWQESEIPAMLHSLDEDMLPGVDIESGGVTFTVVAGRVVANYEAGDA